MPSDSIEQEVRNALIRQGRLAAGAEQLARDADLYEAGLTSHATVNVMLMLEGRFDVEFPDAMLTRGTFKSVDSLVAALTELGVTAP